MEHFNAQLKIEVLAVEETNDSSVHIHSGQWQVSESKLFVTFDDGEKITYEIHDCLLYSEFGLPGCSYGLTPIQRAYKQNTLIMQYGMWRDEDLKKLWNK